MELLHELERQGFVATRAHQERGKLNSFFNAEGPAVECGIDASEPRQTRGR